jgi:hypothetical protein
MRHEWPICASKFYAELAYATLPGARLYAMDHQPVGSTEVS